MNVFDRFRMALIGWQLAADLTGKSRVTATPTWENSQPTYTTVKYTNMVKDGYHKNELIFACLTRTANTAAQVSLKVHHESNGDVWPRNPLQKLLQRPNPFMSEFDFWTSVILMVRLAGKAVYEKERNGAGQVINLWPLRPDWLGVQPSSDQFIANYVYQVPGMKPVPLPVDDVLVFKDWDPLNQYNGYPRVAVAGRVGDVDNSATDFIKLFFEKGGTPPGLLKTVQKLTDAQVTSLRARWRERYGGWENWSEPPILDKDAEYQRTGLTFVEMGFDNLDGRNESRICTVMDVPPILVGAKVGLDRATYSNYKEARGAWWEDSLMPLYSSFQDVVQNQLVPDFDPNDSIMYVEYDFTRVPALQEERNKRWERAGSALKNGGIMVDEYRVEIGLKPLEDGKGQVFLRPANVMEISADGSEPEPTTTEPTTTEPSDEPATEEEEPTVSASDLLSHQYKKNEPAPDDSERRRLERDIARTVAGYYEDLGGAIEKAVTAEVGSNGKTR